MNQKPSLAGFILTGIRNRPGRNLATVFCLAFIAANIFSAQYLAAGMAGALGVGGSRTGADLLVIPTQYALLVKGNQMGPVSAGTIIRVEPSAMRINRSVMDSIGRVPGVSAMSPQLYVASMTVPTLSPVPVDVYGIDPVTDFTVGPWLQESRKKTLGHGEILVGNAVSGDISSLVAIGTGTYTLTGRLDLTRSAVDHAVFMTLDDAYALAAEPGVLPPSTPPVQPGTVSAILVAVEPGADPALVGARIQQPFSYGYLRVLEQHFALKPVSQAAQGLPAIMNTIAVIVILAALPLIALIAAMAAHERQREIGLLVAMGAKRNLIFFIVMAESLLLAMTGAVIGIGASLGAFMFISGGQYIRIPFLQGFQAPPFLETGMMAALALCIVILIGSLAALWPAWRISRMNPYDAIRSGE
jgi:putative ABC transport system permease protein